MEPCYDYILIRTIQWDGSSIFFDGSFMDHWDIAHMITKFVSLVNNMLSPTRLHKQLLLKINELENFSGCKWCRDSIISQCGSDKVLNPQFSRFLLDAPSMEKQSKHYILK